MINRESLNAHENKIDLNSINNKIKLNSYYKNISLNKIKENNYIIESKIRKEEFKKFRN